MPALPSAPVAHAARAGHCPSASRVSGRSLAGRLWLAMVAGTALVFGGMPAWAGAAGAAPVVERTQPLSRADEGTTLPAAVQPQAPVQQARPGRSAARAVDGTAARAGSREGATLMAAAGQARRAVAPRTVNRASAGAAREAAAPSARASRTDRAVRAQRSRRPASIGTGSRGGIRKITATDRATTRGAGAIRLTRAERGVVQHISRKFRVQESSIEQYASYARQAGRVYNIDPYLILAIMATESSFNPRAESRVGAQGLMQVHTRVHRKRFKPYGSTKTVWEPKVNILVGSSILSDYLKRYGGSERRALKAYVGAARLSHDGGYGNKVLSRRDEFVSVSVAARNGATSQATASQADRGGREPVDL